MKVKKYRSINQTAFCYDQNNLPDGDWKFISIRTMIRVKILSVAILMRFSMQLKKKVTFSIKINGSDAEADRLEAGGLNPLGEK